MSLDNVEREYLKFLQKKLKESKQVAEPKTQEQVAPSPPEAVASEAPAPGRGAESHSQRRVLLLLRSKLTI